MRREIAALCLAAIVYAPCAQSLSCVPVFGAGTPRLVTVVKGGALGTSHLGKPRDLQFHPLKNDELWVASASPDGRLDGNFIIKNPGTAKQTVSLLRDRVAYHYMANVAAFAFSADGRALFSCNEADNTYMELANANFFQGPTAYEVYPCEGGYGRPPKSYCNGEVQNEPNCATTEECKVFTLTHDGKKCTGEGCFISHSDMLHEAPLCMGMAHDKNAKTSNSNMITPSGNRIDTWNRTRVQGNVIWHMDGVRGKLMRFDMDELHGIVVIDHRKANIRRYEDVHLTRRPGVPGHMIVDADHPHLYISDTGANRILRVKTDSGRFHRGAMCTSHECYNHENHYWVCGKDGDTTRMRYVNETMCQTSVECKGTPASCFTDISVLCGRDSKSGLGGAGWCKKGECDANPDGFGCYNAFTEMGNLFEYELWGCTEYEVFSTEVKSPSGIALTPDGRVLVADYDSGDIVAFDKAGKMLSRISTGSAGVTALELQCAAGMGDSDDGCRLWFTNIIEDTVSYVSVDTACAANDATPLPKPPPLQQACVKTDEACKKSHDNTCPTARTSLEKERPDFSAHYGGNEWQGRMVVNHAYGKDCTELAKAKEIFLPCTAENCLADGLELADCVGSVECRVGAGGMGGVMGAGVISSNGVTWGSKDEDAVPCPDRIDCINMNLDLLVMAGFFCHPCLPNPCMNSAQCINAAPRQGFTCSCLEGFAGESCEVDLRSSSCGALSASDGVYTPANLCQVNGKAPLGQSCDLQCTNVNMVRVPAVKIAIAAATKPPTSSLPPSQLELLQRACQFDTASRTAQWTGQDSACTCRSRYFGKDCSTLVNPTLRTEKIVGANGDDVVVDGGHGVSIPADALTGDVTVSVNLFQKKDLGDSFPIVAKGFRAVSHLLELLPEGLTFATEATVSIGVIAGEKVKHDKLALFYWDAFSSSWAELTGSAYNKDLKIVQGKSSHFSRWVVLEKPANKGAAWGMWVGIAAAILAGIALVAFVCHRTLIKVNEAPHKSAMPMPNALMDSLPEKSPTTVEAWAQPANHLEPSDTVGIVVRPTAMSGYPESKPGFA